MRRLTKRILRPWSWWGWKLEISIVLASCFFNHARKGRWEMVSLRILRNWLYLYQSRIHCGHYYSFFHGFVSLFLCYWQVAFASSGGHVLPYYWPYKVRVISKCSLGLHIGLIVTVLLSGFSFVFGWELQKNWSF